MTTWVNRTPGQESWIRSPPKGLTCVATQSGDVEVLRAPADAEDYICYIPVILNTSDNSTIDTSKVTATASSTSTSSTLSVSYGSNSWILHVNGIFPTTAYTITVVFELEGYQSITWTGSTVASATTKTELVFQKILTISSEIARLTQAKADIKAAIEAKGVTVGNGTIDTYASKIGEISSGGDSEYVPLILSIAGNILYNSYFMVLNCFNPMMPTAYFVAGDSGDRLDTVLSDSTDSWQISAYLKLPYGVIRRFNTSNMYIQHNTANISLFYADFEFFKITKDFDEVVYSMTNSIGFEQTITEPYEFFDVDLSDAVLCGIRITELHAD